MLDRVKFILVSGQNEKQCKNPEISRKKDLG